MKRLTTCRRMDSGGKRHSPLEVDEIPESWVSYVLQRRTNGLAVLAGVLTDSLPNSDSSSIHCGLEIK
jgi:hypothetical protein